MALFDQDMIAYMAVKEENKHLRTDNESLRQQLEALKKEWHKAYDIGVTAKQQLESLKKTNRLHQLTDDRYYELLSRARRVYRYHGVNSILLDAAIRDMDGLIQRHDREISDEDNEAYEAIDAAMKEQK